MVTQRPEQRRSKRYRQELAVELHDRSGSRHLHAVDVARHGMFIRTDDPPRPRHLVQLTVHLPTGPISAAVTVSRAIHEPKVGGDKGVGVQFFALSAEAKSRWDEYIHALAAQESAQKRQPLAIMSLPGQAPPLPRVDHGAHGGAATFLVKLKSVERLRAFYQDHVLQGGTVLFTPVLRDVGEVVQLVVVHPVTDEEYPVPGVVAAVHAQRPKRLEIHFDLRTPEALASFDAFVTSGKPPPLPVVEREAANAKAERLLQRDALPWEPRALNSPLLGMDLDFDVDVFAEHSIDEEDPIDWDSSIDVDFSSDEISARAASPITTIPRPTVAEEPEEDVRIEVGADDDEDAEPGDAPSTFLLTCDTCDADPYQVDIGPVAGMMGLVADADPFWCPACAKVVGVPRFVDAERRLERRARALDQDAGAEQRRVPMTFVHDVAALHDDPQCPTCGGDVKATKAVERLRDLVGTAESRTKTKVRCGACEKGWLLAAPFRIRSGGG
jgi:hypothetical protein